MFDALRRAETERRRKQEDSSPVPATALGSVPSPARETGPAPVPMPARVPRRELPAHAAGAFAGDMLRELGILRNSIESKLEKKTARVIMFTSAMHEEGVTALAVAYSRLLAMHGEHRVLLIELNARTPALAALMGVSAREGVTHYFSNERPVATLVHRPAGEGFDVLHVGEPDATQIQVNLERAFPHLVREALERYDTVIVDAPPVVMCPETAPLSPFVDGVVLVVHSGRTKRQTVERSIKQIQQFQGRVLGVVLNRKRYYIPHFIYRRL